MQRTTRGSAAEPSSSRRRFEGMTRRPDEAHAGRSTHAPHAPRDLPARTHAWAVLACAFVVALGAGCGDSGADPTCDESECFGAPPAVCDGDVRVTFGAIGTCEGDRCAFPEARRETCAAGCAEGTCVADPCASLDCDTPGPPTCEGDIAVQAQAGTCDPAAATCDRPDPVRTDCAARGERCAMGRCVAATTCDAASCAAPSPPRCEGTVQVTAGGGTCESTDQGETCRRPDVQRRDCAAESLACVEGACVAVACEGPCEAPAPRCEGAIAVRAAGAACDTTVGACTPVDLVRENCALSGQTCVDGACAEVEAPCLGVSCDAPPAPSCVTSRILETWSAASACTDPGTECEYVAARTTCAENASCRQGACVEDACLGVTCASPPAPVCEGSVRVRRSDRGTCAGGTCTYAEDREDCATSGRACRDGACVRSCDVDGCGPTPGPTCDGERVIWYEGDGACGALGCSWATTELDCTLVDARCREGACVPVCGGTVCDDPPAPTCEGTTAVRFADAGTCVEGACSYRSEVENCALDGRRCEAGACVADACLTLTCTTPPADRCEGTTRVESFAGGLCLDGACRWPERRTDCAATGGLCEGGACVGSCVAAECTTPPEGRCEGDTAVRFATTGTCAGGACAYAEERVDCGLDGGICRSGVCLASTCPSGGCGAPPAAVCNGSTAVRYEGPVRCPLGACVWTEVSEPCAEGFDCVAGACVERSPCPGGCVTPPAPFCRGDDRVVPVTPGRCELGLCRYETETVQRCPDSGRVCRSGACVVDPCAGVACTTPDAPFCEGDVLQTPQAPGVCIEGVCTYATRVATDCNAVPEGICSGGACVVQQPCSVTGCPTRPFACDGDTIVGTTGPGICEDDGKCDYEAVFSSVACPEGTRCEGATCVPAPFPGSGAGLISELLITPGAGGPFWVELTNPSGETLSIGGWRLEVTLDPGPSERERSVVFPTGRTIPPFGFVVVADGSAGFASAQTAAWGTWTRARIEWIAADGVRATRIDVDRATWPATAPGQSLQVRGAPQLARQNLPAEWCASEGPGGAAPRATPGFANGACAGGGP